MGHTSDTVTAAGLSRFVPTGTTVVRQLAKLSINTTAMLRLFTSRNQQYIAASAGTFTGSKDDNSVRFLYQSTHLPSILYSRGVLLYTRLYKALHPSSGSCILSMALDLYWQAVV
jgi:hypothetical protein